MHQASDDDIDAYLQSLPPAPEDWTSRAEEVPLLDQAIDALNGDADDASLGAALRSVGLEPDERRLRMLARLRELRKG